MKQVDGTPGFSYAKLACFSIGSATLVLLATALLVGITQPSPNLGLVIALVGVVLAIAVMGVVATKMTNRAFGARSVDEADSSEPPRTQ